MRKELKGDRGLSREGGGDQEQESVNPRQEHVSGGW